MESPTYQLKSGKQIIAIKAIIDRLTSGAATVLSRLAPIAVERSS